MGMKPGVVEAERMTSASPRQSGQPAGRLGLFYSANFLVIGIQLPFWPLWLAGRGLDARQIALVFAAATWAQVLATPAIGALADRLGRRRAVMIALAAAACAAYGMLWPVGGLWPILALNLLAGVAQAALLPLGDSITLAAVRAEGLDYGRVRMWGSLSFIVAAVGGGIALAAMPRSARGGNGVLLLVLAAAVLLLAACAGIAPASPAASSSRGRRVGLRRLFGDRAFRLFVVSAAALQASHQLYYGFGTLYWRGLGFSDTAIGALWAEGVAAEIGLFWLGAPLVRRLGPLGLLLAGGIAGILRWGLMGVVPGLAAAAGLQLLHALTFGAVHLGAMHFLARQAPPAAAASAQSLYAAVSSGFGSGLVMLAAGALYAAYGGHAYPFMALLSAAGLCGVLWLRRRVRVDDAPEL
jgi:MFS transporter, PPP family, 3-phenylpropionic acid transporter